MKVQGFMFAMIVDQVGSRSGPDLVPLALAALSRLDLVLPFERTAGDELQGLTDDPAAVVAAMTPLTRLGGWRSGIGCGTGTPPLPDSNRAARGTAYLAARDAVAAARRSPADLAVVLAPESRGDVRLPGYSELSEAARDAETALWLLRSVLTRRSQEGWELMDLLDTGLSNAAAADRLGISPSAVSQRLGRAARLEALRGTELATRLLATTQRLALAAQKPA